MRDNEPNFVLLLGAGFSRNWGGWLADEVFEYLLGCPEIQNSPEIKKVLWDKRAEGGFESALFEISKKQEKTDYNTLINAVIEMFTKMQNGLRSPFQDNTILHTFLQKFDAIFSLNQDTLLEEQYMGFTYRQLTLPFMTREAYLPYIEGSKVQSYYDRYVKRVSGRTTDIESKKYKLPELGSSIIHEMTEGQPIVKLHGSYDWELHDGNPGVILGGGKEEAIQAFPLLKRYSERFTEYLNKPNTRLMVIGYSFRDEHINKQLDNANNLKMFIVDPRGVEPLLHDSHMEDPRMKNALLGYGSTPQQALMLERQKLGLRLSEKVIGASRRPLHEMFGNNSVEYNKVMRFFDPA